MSTKRDTWNTLAAAPLFRAGIADYWRTDIAAMESSLRRDAPGRWVRQGDRRALALFHAAAERVPAYRDFLRRHRINGRAVRTAADLDGVPFTDKANYVNRYPLAARCWDGKLRNASLIAVSSGTSGEPKFWPRGQRQEMEATLIHELAYRTLFGIHRKSTLAVIGFPMGVYVSGVATLLPTWLTAQRGYPLTAVSVGNNKDQALNVIGKLRRNYDQVLLIGHPFFVKDVVESGKRAGLSWRKSGLRMLFCSEGFSEAWRSYLNRAAGLAADAVAAMNTYGSSETLLIGHETPLTVALRRAASADPELCGNLFASATVPNLFQYNPLLRHVARLNGELLFTSDSGIPLIRFNLHDAGTVIPYADGVAALRKSGRTVPAGSWKLPFIALKGRSDHTLVFYAANIYPEHVHAALNAEKFLGDITGKFALRKGYDRKHEAFLELNIELQPGKRPAASLARALSRHVVGVLRRINMEYDFLWNHLGKDLTPRVILKNYQDPEHFRPGLKPKYLIKE
ncbi:MAG TPA: hypothetical protein VD862_04545 [Candidatus Paceibacterota bacterium]|nr:hypothetical protein [Candidatus Paceibacterota bacterium]